MKTNTMLLLGAAGLVAYFVHKKKSATAASTSALTAAIPRATNPDAGDVTVVPMLTEPDDEVVAYETTGWGPSWGSFRGGGGRRRHRRH